MDEAKLLLTPSPTVKYTNTSPLGLPFSQPMTCSGSIMQQQPPKSFKVTLASLLTDIGLWV